MKCQGGFFPHNVFIICDFFFFGGLMSLRCSESFSTCKNNIFALIDKKSY